MDWQQRKRLAEAAAIEASRLRASANIPRTASVDPIEMAIRCGCEVRFMSLSSLEGVYSPVPKPVVILGSERPAGRRTFTCAHELGHHLFRHGARVDELEKQKETNFKTPEEFLADAFAGYLLMPPLVLQRALKDRGWSINLIEPEQVYRLASFLGVGYGTLISHSRWSLDIMNHERADILLKVQPKMIKERYGASPDTEVVFVDFHWASRAVDLQVGDTLVLPKDAEIDNKKQLLFTKTQDAYSLYKVVTPGYARANSKEHGWAVNIRIARKFYEGLAQYRFFEEMEDE